MFSNQVNTFTRRYSQRLDRVLQQTTRAAYYEILQASRVDTGKFRGNWRIGVNRRDLRVTKKAPPRSAGTRTGQPPTRAERAFASNSIKRIKRDSTVNITNAVEYAPFIPDAPTAVLGLTIQKVRAKFNAIARQARQDRQESA